MNIDRLRSIDRALMAGRLVQPELYDKTEKAIKNTDEKRSKKEFYDVCRDAKITDMELVDHMWEIVVAARSVYMGQAPGIIW